MVVVLIGKLLDESLNKMLAVVGAEINKKKIDNEKEKLKDKLDKIITKVDDVKYGSTFSTT